MNLALAMKLDNFGISEYSLRKIFAGRLNNTDFIKIYPATKESDANILKSFPTYYDEPLYHKPPLFAYALALSHRIFASDKPYMALYAASSKTNIFKRPTSLLKTQFYCAIVPVVFSLLLILTTFIVGRTFFSTRTALYSAILLSVSPIELLSSQKIWAEDMLSFFVIVAVFLYYIGKERNSYLLSFLSGIGAGLAALTKPSGNITLLIILGYEAYYNLHVFFKPKTVLRLTNKRIILVFLGSFILISIPWYYQIFRNYSTLFYMPHLIKPELLNQVPWFKFVFNRPWYMYLINIPFQNPILFLIYPSIIWIFIQRSNVCEGTREKKIILLIWIAAFFICFWTAKVGRELRYILPAYPAIALLSAEFLNSIQKRLGHKSNPFIVNIVVITIIIFSGWWSIRIGLSHVLNNLALIIMPF